MAAFVSWFMLCLLFDDKDSRFVFQGPDKWLNVTGLLASSHQGVVPIFTDHTSSPELLPELGCPPPNTSKFSTTDWLRPVQSGIRDLWEHKKHCSDCKSVHHNSSSQFVLLVRHSRILLKYPASPTVLCFTQGLWVPKLFAGCHLT